MPPSMYSMAIVMKPSWQLRAQFSRRANREFVCRVGWQRSNNPFARDKWRVKLEQLM